jgi:hypothetical protein
MRLRRRVASAYATSTLRDRTRRKPPEVVHRFFVRRNNIKCMIKLCFQRDIAPLSKPI